MTHMTSYDINNNNRNGKTYTSERYSVVPVPAPQNAPPGSSAVWAQYKLNTASGICMGTYDPVVGNLMDECSFNLFNTSYNPNNNLKSSITDNFENFGNMKVDYEYKKSTNNKCKAKY